MAGALGIALAGPRSYGGVTIEDAIMGTGGRRDLGPGDIRRCVSTGSPTRCWRCRSRLWSPGHGEKRIEVEVRLQVRRAPPRRPVHSSRPRRPRRSGRARRRAGHHRRRGRGRKCRTRGRRETLRPRGGRRRSVGEGGEGADAVEAFRPTHVHRIAGEGDGDGGVAVDRLEALVAGELGRQDEQAEAGWTPGGPSTPARSVIDRPSI